MSHNQGFKELCSKPVIMTLENIDTDQIIPARFLTTTTREGLGTNLFNDWRYNADGSEKSDFILNQPEAKSRTILVGGNNFGCGSSREHAPWALTDFGFQAVLSTEIADIFRNNASKNGLVPIQIEEDFYQYILDNPNAEIFIDLEACRVNVANGPAQSFELEAFARHCLMNGVDQLGFLMSQADAITRFEETRA